jgi:hypothetical protein
MELKCKLLKRNEIADEHTASPINWERVAESSGRGQQTELNDMRIYIESTIPSYVVARPARDLIQAAHQQLTRDWWDLQRVNHKLFTSQIVLDEISAGERAMAECRLELMAEITLLDLTDEANALTKEILGSGLLPATADRDAAHIALASIHEMDILLTWNCRHIANAAIVGRLRKLVAKQGHTLPEIYTPDELMGINYEQDD